MEKSPAGLSEENRGAVDAPVIGDRPMTGAPRDSHVNQDDCGNRSYLNL